MSLIGELIRKHLLLEDRIGFLKSKFESAIKPDEFEKIKQADPSQNKQYLQWIIAQYLKLSPAEKVRFTKEDFSKVADDLSFYNKYKVLIPTEWRDINKMLSFEDLSYIVKPIREKKEKEIEQTQASKDVKKVFENYNYLIIIPNTEESSCLYGAGTRWCTSSKSNNRFKYYNEEGPLFIIIHKNEKYSEGRESKYQFHFESGQFMDVGDNQINISEYIKENPQVADAISKYMINWNYEPQALVKNFVILKRTDLIPDDVVEKIKNINVSKDGFKIGFDILYGLYKGGKFDIDTVNKLAMDKTVELHKDGVYAIYDDWSDEKIIELFAKGRNNDYQYAAKQIFGGDAWEWHMDYDEYSSLNNFNGNGLDIETIKEIKTILIKQGVKKKDIIKLDGSSLLTFIDENNYEDLSDLILRGINDSYRDALSSAYWEAYTKAVIEKLGPYKFENDKLKFKVDFESWLQKISSLTDYEESDFEYDYFTSWIVNALEENDEKITMRSEYYGSPDNKEINVMIRERLTELL